MTGSNEYLIQQEVNKYKRRAGDFDWVELPAPDIKELNAEIHSAPLIANFRCVIVRSLKNLPDTNTAASLFTNKGSMCQLILAVESFKGKQKLRDAVKNNGKLEKFVALDNKTATEYIIDALGSHGLKMSTEARDYFLFLVGPNAAAIDTNLDMLIGKEPLTIPKLRENVVRRTEINIFSILDKVYNSEERPYELLRAYPDKMALLNMAIFKARQAIIVKSSKTGIVGGGINAYAAKILRKQVKPIPLEAIVMFYARLNEIFYIAIRSNQESLEAMLTSAVIDFRKEF